MPPLRMPSLLSRMASASIVDKESYFPFIDGLRGIAVLMVIAGHFAQAEAGGAKGFRFGLVEHYFSALQIGVELFFILSAFTLFNTSRKRLARDARPFASFYLRRAFRILPFWWIAVAGWAIYRHESFGVIASGATFVFGFLRFRHAAIVDPVPGGWSLFVEETFYLLLPILLIRIVNLRRALILLIALMGVSTAWTELAMRTPALRVNYFYYLFPLENWYAFAFGIVAYFLIVQRRSTVAGLDRRIVRIGVDVAMIAGGLFLVLQGVRLATFTVFALVLVAASPRTLVGRLTRTPLLMRFGRYCYSIYLTHFFVIAFAGGLIQRMLRSTGLIDRAVEVRWIALFPVFAAVSLGLGFLTFNGIERPCILLGKRLVRRVNESRDAVPDGSLAPASVPTSAP